MTVSGEQQKVAFPTPRLVCTAAISGTSSFAAAQIASSPEIKATGTPKEAAVKLLSINSLMRFPLRVIYRLLPVEVWLTANSGQPAAA